ncbi:MAG: hypothetical protein QJR09_12140 [Micrococcus sp.]|nr:hypothetical protein [Micrococcus sp.]
MFTLLALGLGLALVLTLAYGVLRTSPWSPHDGGALAWARLHGLATALIATVAVLTAASFLQSLQADHGPEEFSVVYGLGAEAIALPASALDPRRGLLVAVFPGLWLLGVYAIAQRTWPRVTGPVRTARLAPRRATDLLPPVLPWAAAGIGLASLAAVALAWTAPGAPPVHLSYSTEGSTLEGFSGGARPGTEFAPWLLLALVALAAATACVTVLVSRRPTLTGLTADEDLAVRRIAVHRVLRTTAAGALVVLAVAVAGWAEGTLQAATRAAYGGLDGMAASYAEGVTLDGEGSAHLDFADPPATGLPAAFDYVRHGTPAATLFGLVVLLLWRPRGAEATTPTGLPAHR